MLDIVVCEIAGLQRHGNPVHGRALFCAKSSWCRDASSGRRHEGTTIKRCHFNLPDFLKLSSDRAKCKARRASTGNATTLAEYRKAPCNYPNDKEAGQGPRFASISSERHSCIPFVSLTKCRTCASTRRRSEETRSLVSPAARAPRAATRPPHRRARLRIFVVRCGLPCDPPVGGHSCNGGMIPRFASRGQ